MKIDQIDHLRGTLGLKFINMKQIKQKSQTKNPNQIQSFSFIKASGMFPCIAFLWCGLPTTMWCLHTLSCLMSLWEAAHTNSVRQTCLELLVLLTQLLFSCLHSGLLPKQIIMRKSDVSSWRRESDHQPGRRWKKETWSEQEEKSFFPKSLVELKTNIKQVLKRQLCSSDTFKASCLPWKHKWAICVQVSSSCDENDRLEPDLSALTEVLRPPFSSYRPGCPSVKNYLKGTTRDILYEHERHLQWISVVWMKAFVSPHLNLSLWQTSVHQKDIFILFCVLLFHFRSSLSSANTQQESEALQNKQNNKNLSLRVILCHIKPWKTHL